MISMPVNVYPSSLSGFGDGVIDVTDGLTVSWQFSGEPLKKYQIVIYQNDAESTQKYDTGVVTLTNPFYPTDAKGNQTTFYATKITAAQLETAGIVNGYSNGYKMVITQYNLANESVTQHSASAFITRAKPTVTIGSITDPYTQRSITITASYYQAQGDAIYSVRWILVDTNDYDTYLIDTGDIQTSVLQLSYDGLFSDTTYAVKCIIETENGVVVDSGWTEFDVEYTMVSSEGLVTACRPSGMPYIQVSWINRTTIDGELYPDPQTPVAGTLFTYVTQDTDETILIPFIDDESTWNGCKVIKIGKNMALLPASIMEESRTDNGILFRAVSENMVLVQGTANDTAHMIEDPDYGSSDMYLLGAGEYVLSTNLDVGNGNKVKMYAYAVDGSGVYYSLSFDSTAPLPFTLNKEAFVYFQIEIALNSSISQNVWIQLEKGTQATTYSQYAGDYYYISFADSSPTWGDRLNINTGLLEVGGRLISYNNGEMITSPIAIYYYGQDSGDDTEQYWFYSYAYAPDPDPSANLTRYTVDADTYQLLSSITGGVLHIAADSYCIWEHNDTMPFVFSEPWSFAWRGQMSNLSSDVNVLTLGTDDEGDPFVLTVSDDEVTLTRGETTIFTESVSLKINDWLVVVVTEDHYYIKHVTYSGGLMPSSVLYPETTLYPEPSSTNVINYDGACSYTQDGIISLRMDGEQNCEYLWLYSGEFNTETISNMVSTSWYEPSYDANTYFLATFANNDLGADITGGNGDILYGASIYRKESGNSLMQHIADISSDFLTFRDFGTVSKKTYTYTVFLRGEETFIATPYVSQEITPQYGYWTLIETEMRDDGKYHVKQFFNVAGNISSGSISNNNKPNLLENFTKYPTWQPSPQNYKSGTLTALIGSFDAETNQYNDSWSLADEIMEVSRSTNPKFLRDIKGAMWLIETNGAVTVQVNDKSGTLPIKMSYPWVEVGDSSDKSIILFPNDELWESDEIINTTVAINMDTMELFWTVPDKYSGSNLRIGANGDLMQTGTGLIEMASMRITDDGDLIATV